VITVEFVRYQCKTTNFRSPRRPLMDLVFAHTLILLQRRHRHHQQLSRKTLVGWLTRWW
jgi:hypothetical protein